MFNLSDWVIKTMTDISNELANACFDWLKIFMLSPTDFSGDNIVNDLYSIIASISVTLGGLLLIFNLIKLGFQITGGYASRSVSEVTTKSILGTVMGALTPFILNNVLIAINNAFVNMMLAKGVTVSTLTAMVAVTNPTITIAIFTLLIAATFLILTVQYTIRYAKLLILFINGPLCAITMMNEDINAFGPWFKDALTTVFTQSYHMLVLYIIANKIGTITGLKDLLMCFGLMVVLIMPGLFQLGKFIASTGSGRTAAGAAGGAAKMGMMKFLSKF